ALVVNVYNEVGRPLPGKKILDPEPGVGIPDSTTTGFSGLIFGTATATGAFRMCLRQQVDDTGQTNTSRPVLFDGHGASVRNTMFAPSKGGWINAPAANVTGDFVLRAIVIYNDLGPWNAGGACAGGDGGVPHDASGGNDGSPGFDGGPGNDSGGGGDTGVV